MTFTKRKVERWVNRELFLSCWTFCLNVISLCNGDAGQEETVSSEFEAIVGKKPLTQKLLSVNELLPEEKRNKIKYTFNFKVNKSDLQYFNSTLEEFIISIYK